MIVGGRLSEAGTGRQLLARAKDEPCLSVFVLSTNIASNVRTRYLSSSRKKKDKIYFRLLHLVPSSLRQSPSAPIAFDARPNFYFSRDPDGDASKAKRGRFSIRDRDRARIVERVAAGGGRKHGRSRRSARSRDLRRRSPNEKRFAATFTAG